MNECSICYEKINFFNKSKEFWCHNFHKKCINQWIDINYSCPVCRNEINWNKIKTNIKFNSEKYQYIWLDCKCFVHSAILDSCESTIHYFGQKEIQYMTKREPIFNLSPLELATILGKKKIIKSIQFYISNGINL